MQFIETPLADLWIIEPRVFADSRGFFLESWKRETFEAHGITADFCQDNHARSTQPGVLRGIHFQTPPMAQAKLVRVTQGAVFDVAVDLRRGSPTYGQWFGVELSADNHRMLFVPRGFGHGYMTLVANTDFQYKVDAPYAPDCDSGLAWDDPELAVAWPLESEPVLSDKDRALPAFRDFDTPFAMA